MHLDEEDKTNLKERLQETLRPNGIGLYHEGEVLEAVLGVFSNIGPMVSMNITMSPEEAATFLYAATSPSTAPGWTELSENEQGVWRQAVIELVRDMSQTIQVRAGICFGNCDHEGD